MPTTQREQAMLVACVVAIAAAGLYFQYVWRKKDTALVEVQSRIDTLTIANETARQEIARGNAAKMREEAEQYGRMLTQMRQLVPTANEVPALIDNISTSARRVGLDLGPMEPLGVVQGGVFDTHKWRMQVTGPYHRVAEFLTNVGNLTRIVAPMNLQLTPSARAGLRRLPNQQHLDAQFEIQTYVARPAPVPGAAPARAGAGGTKSR